MSSGTVAWFVLWGLLTCVVLVAVAVAAARAVTGDPKVHEWARSRRVALTGRSAPYVDAYLRNARRVRLVGAAGALGLVLALRSGVGVDVGGFAYAWVLTGYAAGCVAAELSLARVPAASTTRVASLAVRRLRDYRMRWVAVGQAALPAVLVALAALAVVGGNGDASRFGANWWSAEAVHTATVVAGVLGLVSLAATEAAQRHIVRRPQPRTEPDLVAADEALRTAAVHVLGVSHLVLCCALAVSGVVQLDYRWTSSRAIEPATTVAVLGLVLAGAVLWCVRLQPPGAAGGAVAPPRFSARSAAATGAPAPDETPAWRTRPRLDLAAAAVAGVLCLALAGLHWLGPINPAVSATALTTVSDGPYPDRAEVTVLVENGSALPVEVVAVRTDLLGPELPSGPASAIVRIESSGSAVTEPWTLPGQRSAALAVTVQGPPCGATAADPLSEVLVPLVVEIETVAGRRQLLPTGSPSTTTLHCRFDLPTGPGPADPAAARAAVEDAFRVVYGGPADPATKATRIDRPEGLDAPGEQAAHGPYATEVARVRPVLQDLGYDRPDHAVLRYQLRDDTGSFVRDRRRGEAVFVDGTWKLTRETVCADLALAQARCP
jgi:hypothetical protein